MHGPHASAGSVRSRTSEGLLNRKDTTETDLHQTAIWTLLGPPHAMIFGGLPGGVLFQQVPDFADGQIYATLGLWLGS